MTTLSCTGCGSRSGDGYKPCDCLTMVGMTDNFKAILFRDPAKRDAVAKIICRHLTGKEVAADGAYDDWLCPMDDEAANNMCSEIADKIIRAEA